MLQWNIGLGHIVRRRLVRAHVCWTCQQPATCESRMVPTWDSRSSLQSLLASLALRLTLPRRARQTQRPGLADLLDQNAKVPELLRARLLHWAPGSTHLWPENKSEALQYSLPEWMGPKKSLEFVDPQKRPKPKAFTKYSRLKFTMRSPCEILFPIGFKPSRAASLVGPPEMSP